MPVNVNFHGTVYPVPLQGDKNWGAYTSRYLVALGTYSLANTGGLFTLTNDINFGPTFGLLSKYFTSITSTPATAGAIRLAKTDTIDWRNNANSGENVLAVNGSDQLTYNGAVLSGGFNTLADGTIWIGSATNVPVAQTLTGDVTVSDLGVTAIGALKIVNAQISASAGIVYSKLTLTGSIVNADIGSAASIVYSKLSLANSIVNADINTAAAIALSKLAALTASKVLVSDGSGVISPSTITTTTLGYLDATSSIQTQINSKQATLTTGNLTEVTSSVLTITGGTGAVIGSGTTIQVAQASGSVSGFLSSTDWSTFSGKQNAFAGLNTDGVLYATSATAISSTTVGTAGQVLTSNGAAVAPTFQNSTGGVTSVHADANSNITGAVHFISGSNVTLTQSGQDITVASSGGSTAFREDYVVGTALNNYTGSTTVFNLVNAYNVGGHTLIVLEDGDVQTIGATNDYLETNSTTVTFNNALVVGEKVGFIFSTATSSSGIVNSGTAGQIAYYATSTGTVSTSGAATVAAGGNLIITGTVTNDSATAGKVGEYISSAVTPASPITLTSTQYADVTSISLTAGDWDVTGMVGFDTGGVVTTAIGGISTTTGNSSTGLNRGDTSEQIGGAAITTATDSGVSIPSVRASLSGTTTYYLKAMMNFTVSGFAYGRISARRVR